MPIGRLRSRSLVSRSHCQHNILGILTIPISPIDFNFQFKRNRQPHIEFKSTLAARSPWLPMGSNHRGNYPRHDSSCNTKTTQRITIKTKPEVRFHAGIRYRLLLNLKRKPICDAQIIQMASKGCKSNAKRKGSDENNHPLETQLRENPYCPRSKPSFVTQGSHFDWNHRETKTVYFSNSSVWVRSVED